MKLGAGFRQRLVCFLVGHRLRRPSFGGTLFYQCARCSHTVDQGSRWGRVLWRGRYYRWPPARRARA